MIMHRRNYRDIAKDIPWAIIAIVGGILALIIILILIFIPKYYDLSVADKSWERKVIIEEHRTVQEEDWYIPVGGRLLYTYRAVRYYEDVQIGVDKKGRPIYERTPVYDTMYVYKIKRWKFDHYETTSGHTDTPYFAEPELTSNYRTNGTIENYTILAFKDFDSTKTETYYLSLEDWQSVSLDSVIHVRVHFGNHAEILYDE